jgi:hypothetical protein
MTSSRPQMYGTANRCGWLTPLSRRSWALVAWCSLAAACGNDQGSQTQATIRDSAGVAIVENTGPGWGSETGWRVSPEPVLRIGSVDAAMPSVGGPAGPAENFSYVLGATRLSDGTVVVLDGQSAEVRWFASDGAHVRTRGGRGGGPGEFRSARGLVRLPGDSVLVQGGRWKQVLFSPNGDLLRDEATDLDRYRALGMTGECATLTLPDRSVLACQPIPGGPPRPGIGGPQPPPGLYRSYDRLFLVPWTLDSAVPLGLDGGIESWGMEDGRGGRVYTVHPFFSSSVVGAGGSPPRIAVAINPHYSIELWTTGGRLDRIVRRTGGRREATEEERAKALEEVRGSAMSDPAMKNRVLADIQVPDSIPSVYGLNVAPDGSLWVKRDLSSLFGGPSVYDVFDPEGEFLGEIRFPPRFRIHDVGDDYVLGVRTAEYDVPFVEMYSLQRPPLPRQP